MTYGADCLVTAALSGQLGLTELLLSLSSNLNLQDADGGTSLSCAAFEGRVAVVQLLLDTGCEIVPQTQARIALSSPKMRGGQATGKTPYSEPGPLVIERQLALFLRRLSREIFPAVTRKDSSYSMPTILDSLPSGLIRGLPKRWSSGRRLWCSGRKSRRWRRRSKRKQHVIIK